MKDNQLSAQRIVALIGVILLIGVGLSIAPATLAQDSGVETPTPSNDGGPNDPYDCGDFDSREEVNAVFDPNDDVSNLDDDGDGIACEGQFPPVNAGQGGAPSASDSDDGGETTSTSTATETTSETATPTTEEETAAAAETETETDTPTPTETETTTSEETTEAEQTDAQPAESDDADAQNDIAYYQVDFVVGEPIENLRGPEGTYTNDQLIRFAHGSTNEPIMRLSDGEFITDEDLAERIESQAIEVEDGTATVTFTVTEGESLTFTLASYEKIGPGWSPETEAQQEFVDAETNTFGPGTYTLSVDLPDDGTDEATDDDGETPPPPPPSGGDNG